MQPQQSFQRNGARGPTKTVAVLALVAAGCVVLGWFVPYFSIAGQSVALSDDSNSFQLAIFGPSILAAIGAFLALSGQRRGAAIAAGAAAGVSSLCLVFVAVAYEFVSSADDFENFGGSGYEYGAGFYLHIAAAVLAVLIVLLTFGLLQEAASDEARIVNPAIAVLGALGIGAAALGMLLPNDGYSVFDIPSGPIKGAYLTFIGIFGLLGVIGFASGRPTGSALGVGAASAPFLVWLADAVEHQSSGSSFFGGFNDGNTALVAIGSAVAIVVGVIAMVSAGPSRTPAPFGLPGQQSTPQFADRYGSSSTQGYESMSTWPTEWAPQDAPVAVPSPVAVPEGWYPDPLARHEQRYWNGGEWTAHVANGSVTGTDPL